MSDKSEHLINNRTLAIASHSPFIMHDSASRGQMFTSHRTSSVLIKEPTVPTCNTFIDQEYKHYAFGTKFEEDATLVGTIDVYPRTIDENNINNNPRTLFIIEHDNSNVIDYVEMCTYHTLHEQFGFLFKIDNNKIDEIERTRRITAGTSVAYSPAIMEDGNYSDSRMANTVLMEIPLVNEDGIGMSVSMCKKMTTTAVTKHTIVLKQNEIPLSLYNKGNNGEYNILPDIGEKVREDGLLFAKRKSHPIHAITDQTAEALTVCNDQFDDPIYVEPGAEVLDIKVIPNHSIKRTIPTRMVSQLDKYISATNASYVKLRKMVDDRMRNNKKLEMSPALENLYTYSLAAMNEFGTDRNVSIQYRGSSLGEYLIEVVITYPLEPNIGAKFTDSHGCKGVIVAKIPDEDMPVDALGNRADIIAGMAAVVKRTVAGRVIEMWIASACRDHVRRTYLKYGKDPDHISQEVIKELVSNPDIREEMWNDYLGLLELISPRHVRTITSEEFIKFCDMEERNRINAKASRSILGFNNAKKERPLSYKELELIRFFGIEGHSYDCPPDNELNGAEVCENLYNSDKYRPCYGPVTYRTTAGDLVTTVDPVHIGYIYTIQLDKNGYHYAAVSSAKTQHMGVAAKLTMNEKYAAPVRNQCTRVISETEGRIFSATMGDYRLSELMEQTNDPLKHAAICKGIYEADNPMQVYRFINPEEFGGGKSRPVLIVRNIAQCGGIRFEKRLAK